MMLAALPRDMQRRTRWRNDQGWTTELWVEPEGASLAAGFDWRVSIAEVEGDCAFSNFDGYDRTLLLLDGAGIALRDGPHAAVRLDQRGQAHRFPGELSLDCRVLDGPTRDFNVMTRRGALSHHVWLRPLLGPMVLMPEAGVRWFVHVLNGHAQQQHEPKAPRLAAGDSALSSADGVNKPIVLSGGGEIVLVKIATVIA
jgi:hypothetical protein